MNCLRSQSANHEGEKEPRTPRSWLKTSKALPPVDCFLGDNPIINLNSFLRHINYVCCRYRRPLQWEQMASLLSINGPASLLARPGHSGRPCEKNPSGAKRAGSSGGAQIFHPAVLSHLVGSPQEPGNTDLPSSCQGSPHPPPPHPRPSPPSEG